MSRRRGEEKRKKERKKERRKKDRNHRAKIQWSALLHRATIIKAEERRRFWNQRRKKIMVGTG